MSRLRQQRRGKGSSNYRSHKPSLNLTYPTEAIEKGYTIIKILRDGLKSAPIGVYQIESTDTRFYNIAPIGVYVGQKFNKDSREPGTIIKLKDIEPGVEICNLAVRANEDGKLLRSAGVKGKVIKQEESLTFIKTKKEILNFSCDALATIGIPGGGGHTLKPILKAGTSAKMYASKAKKSRTVSAKNKNHHEHPFGASKSKSPGRHKTCSRHAPPGAKVGSIAAKRTGKK